MSASPDRETPEAEHEREVIRRLNEQFRAEHREECGYCGDLLAENERLREALRRIAKGPYSRPLDEPWSAGIAQGALGSPSTEGRPHE